MRLAHLNLEVADVERSLRFYGTWFGFDRREQRYPDGTVFVRDAEGFDLAFRAGRPPSPPAPSVHFGFRSDDPVQVRELRARLRAAGVELTESYDEEGYVNATVS